MAFEANMDLVLVLLVSIGVILVMIGFYLAFGTHIQGGWLTSIASALKWLVLPPV